MRGLRAGAVLVTLLVTAIDLYSAEYSSLTCADNFIRDPLLKISCGPYDLYVDRIANGGSFVKAYSCHFPNQRTSYILNLDGEQIIDERSEDGLLVHRNLSCGEIEEILLSIAEKPAASWISPLRRDFIQRESVALIASESTCQSALATSLNEYLELLRREGRSASQLICLQNKIIENTNPSVVRNQIQVELKDEVSGLILIGADIPTFEIFYRTGWELPWSPYKYGSSDLPYGSRDAFWNAALLKRDPRLREEVYKSKDYLYPLDSPTKFAFDLNPFIERERWRQTYRQERWVARWIASREAFQNAFSSFLARRKKYQPLMRHQLIFARGAVSFMYTPLEDSFRGLGLEDIKSWTKRAPNGSRAQIYSQTNLAELVSNLSHEIDFLVLNEHGSPSGIGNMNLSSFHKLNWLPEFVHFDSCFGGAWAYAGRMEDSILVSAFEVSNPPLALLASQGIKGIPTFGVSGSNLKDNFLMYWKEGQSLGQRQIEAFNRRSQEWFESQRTDSFMDSSWLDVFHTYSIFGDGTIEF